MERRSSAVVPIEIIDHDEFQAIELAIAAAESSITSHSSSSKLPNRTSSASPSQPTSRRLPCWQHPRSNLALRHSDENNIHVPENPGKDANDRPSSSETVGHASCVAASWSSCESPKKEKDSVANHPWGIEPSSYRGGRRGGVSRCRLPSLKFRGEIVYCNSELEAERASRELLNRIEMKKCGGVVVSALGFDTEWKVVFKRGAQRHKVSVLQLCADLNSCFVFHIIHTGIPSVLQTILQDPSIAKVGVCAHGDASKILSDYGVHVKGVKDLCGIANVKLRGSVNSTRSWSLSSLAEELLGKQVEKTATIRMGDWEVHTLSASQLHYAATDAFASLHLFQVLLTFPDP